MRPRYACRALNRRTRQLRDEAGVVERFGVLPRSILDYLALVGDSPMATRDRRMGAKSAAAVLARYRHLEGLPPIGGNGRSTR